MLRSTATMDLSMINLPFQNDNRVNCSYSMKHRKAIDKKNNMDHLDQGCMKK
jgi:hypothetical protein